MADPLPQPTGFSPTSEPLPPKPPPTRIWLWALVFIFILVCGALVFLLNLYNSQSALTQDRLTAAQTKWRNTGVKDYNFDVRVEGGAKGHYHVEVRGGELTDKCTMNGQPMEREAAKRWTVDALLEDILSKEIENQNAPQGQSCYSEVDFDEVFGFPKRYLRSNKNGSTLFIARLQLEDLSKPLPQLRFEDAGGGGVGTRAVQALPTSTAGGGRGRMGAGAPRPPGTGPRPSASGGRRATASTSAPSATPPAKPTSSAPTSTAAASRPKQSPPANSANSDFPVDQARPD